MSYVDMTWAQSRPQMIPATPPTWERPRLNPVGAMQAAQQYLTQQQAYETAKAEAPVNLAFSKARLAAAEHGLARQGVEDQLQDVQLGSAKLGLDTATKNAAEAETLRPLDLEARKADLIQKIKNGQISNDQINKASVIADGIKEVFKYPDGSPEQIAMWNTFIDGAAAKGIYKPEEADYWKAHGPDRAVALQALNTDATIKQALLSVPSYGNAATDYNLLPVAQKARIETMAVQEARSHKAFGEAVTPEDITAAKQAIMTRMGIRTGAAGAAPAGSLVKDQGDYENKVDRPVRKSDKISEGASDRGLTVAEKKAGQPKKTKATAAEYPRDAPAEYTGDANDEAAQHDWFAKIPPGSWFVNPGTGDILPKAK